MLVLNASSETQQVRVFGNYFTLKPGQIKNFQDDIAHFMCTDRRYHGFVALPEEFGDPGYADTEEGKAKLLAAKTSGVEARIAFLKRIINNELVALKQDYDTKNDKSDPRAIMSEGALASMRELAGYQDLGEDAQRKKIEEAKALEEKIKTMMR